MATFLRTWSYKYQWLYDGISTLSALSVGGEKRFRHLALEGLQLASNWQVLDLCCGAGQTTKYLVQYSDNVTGVDISPVALRRAARQVPQAKYVEGLAQKLPLADRQFDLVHVSVALHEMTGEERQQIFREVYRVLKPEGIFTLVDFHQPTKRLFELPLNLFLWLFETETAWQLLETDLGQRIEAVGLQVFKQRLYAGGSLQVIQSRKGSDNSNESKA